MSRLLAASLGVVLCVSTQVARAQDNELTPEDKGAGWTLLFDGKTLDGWMRSDGKPSNRGVDHEAHQSAPLRGLHDGLRQGVLELRAEVRLTRSPRFAIAASSCGPIRSSRGKKGRRITTASRSPSTTASKRATTRRAPFTTCRPCSIDATKPTGQWNHIEITCDKSNITVVLNGKQVNSIDLDKFTEPNKRPNGTSTNSTSPTKTHPRHGYIGLQDHGSPCWFKNIKLRELK